MEYKLDNIVGDFDNYLNQALIYLKERWFEPRTGFVSCTLKDEKGIVFSTNTFEDDGKIIHAEHNAINLFQRKFGKITKQAIVAVTLSPCIIYSENRIGPSCSSLLSKQGVKILHVGHLHEKQGDLNTYRDLGFIPSVTKNSKLSTVCKNLLNFYLSNKRDLMIDIRSWVYAKKQIGTSIFNYK